MSDYQAEICPICHDDHGPNPCKGKSSDMQRFPCGHNMLTAGCHTCFHELANLRDALARELQGLKAWRDMMLTFKDKWADNFTNLDGQLGAVEAILPHGPWPDDGSIKTTADKVQYVIEQLERRLAEAQERLEAWDDVFGAISHDPHEVEAVINSNLAAHDDERKQAAARLAATEEALQVRIGLCTELQARLAETERGAAKVLADAVATVRERDLLKERLAALTAALEDGRLLVGMMARLPIDTARIKQWDEQAEAALAAARRP